MGMKGSNLCGVAGSVENSICAADWTVEEFIAAAAPAPGGGGT